MFYFVSDSVKRKTVVFLAVNSPWKAEFQKSILFLKLFLKASTATQVVYYLNHIYYFSFCELIVPFLDRNGILKDNKIVIF